MEFETELSRETIKQRLAAFTKPLNISNRLSEHQLLSKWNSGNTFYLFKTGGFISMRPILPFVAKVEVRDNSAYIVGKFSLTKSTKIVTACFFGLAWSMAFVGCFFNGNFEMSAKLFIFVAYAIWTIIGYSFIRFIPGLFQRKQQSDVIEFIRQHLLN